MKKIFLLLCILTLVFGVMGVKSADALTIGTYNLDDSAFVDAVVSSYATAGDDTFDDDNTQGSPSPTLDVALTDLDWKTGVHLNGPITLDFTDNLVVNEGGKDLVFFEVAKAIQYIQVTVNGVTLQRIFDIDTGVDIAGLNKNGDSRTWDLMALELNLDLFGLAAGETISSLEVTYGPSNPDVFNQGVPQLSLVGALNSSPVPEPTTLLLLGTGLIGLAAVGRKKFFKDKI